jgi:hypothetical protein
MDLHGHQGIAVGDGAPVEMPLFQGAEKPLDHAVGLR